MHLRVLAQDGSARAALLELSSRGPQKTHGFPGALHTPAFMPVGTNATVKALSPQELQTLGVQAILANTYHLYLRPGHKVLRSLGGLHAFMGFQGLIITDSGGFQVWSLSPLRKITPEGVEFRSHLDGSTHFLSPELSVQIQASLGADIFTALDECTPYPAERSYALQALRRTTVWAQRSLRARDRLSPGKPLFAIVQGGMFQDLRAQSLEELLALSPDGLAVGGLSVGEPKGLMHEMIAFTGERLPRDRPRYLMGVGDIPSLLRAVEAGFDMFDCVIPTRDARNGTLFTTQGRVSIKQARFKDDPRALDEQCGCYSCQNFSRAYLRHLYLSGELLGLRLNTLHNLHFYMWFFSQMRQAIKEGRFQSFKRHWEALPW